ncbi:filamentous hemagglutinin family outer membrane protein [[Leptolyngbya] sp. PCC 7376]|uniref:CHAT domain-containing protein n=1 Tax=[Leptolyngbya] sp. PCC 7376 TaxID=111781 RepID=UPI00029F20F9|nr:CHAT domain-containing protein [[Leptolyngbya] sp. PCC 7376]AFY37889.1 filamentous hemagglutinin family outer membrane protein [[Leptolyngbya] sp. PCC 7376]
MSRLNNFLILSLLPLPISLALSGQVIAQISAANDGTGTIVDQQGNTFAIQGGSLSGDGTNLFHNFTDFNLSTAQTATFLGNPTLQNILSKVSGGNPSYIDGLLQVSGSNANLFLLNSAGLVFGENAQLDLTGNFTATTASGIGFGEEEWLGSNNYSTLIGAPTVFSFDGTGAIINAADLQVNTGRSLNLFASNVVNTGTLTAEQGNIQLIAVPETNNLRLNQNGQILGLELPMPSENLSLVDLPQLLTGGNLGTGLTVENNTVKLASTQTVIPQISGSTFIRNLIDASGDLGGNVNIFGQAIALNDATLDISGNYSGGNILVGGAFQGSGDLPRALTTSIDATSFLKADAMDVGNGGEIIIWSDGRTDFDGFLSAQGGLNGGDAGLAEVSSKGFLDLASGWSQRINLGASNGNSGTLLLDPTDIRIGAEGTSGAVSIPSSPFEPDTASIILDTDIVRFLDGIEGVGGADLVISTAGSGGDQGNITFDPLAEIQWGASSSSLTFQADNNIVIGSQNRLETFGPGNLTLQAGGEISSGIDIGVTGGTLMLSADGNINVANLVSNFGAPSAGDIIVTSTNGSIVTQQINTLSFMGNAGSVNLQAKGDIQVEYIDATSLGGNGGDIDVKTEGFFRATGTGLSSFTMLESSLNTSSENIVIIDGGDGGQGGPFPPPSGEGGEETPMGTAGVGGSIRIEHGGNGATPFIVGDATTNGTQGRIISDLATETTLTNEIVPTESYLETYIQGDIAIITGMPEVPVTPIEPPVEPEPIPDPPDCFPDCAKERQSRAIPTGTEEEEIEGEDPRATLKHISEETGQEPAIVYVYTETVPSTSGQKALGNKVARKTAAGETEWEFSGDRLTDYLNNATNNFLNPRATLDQEAILHIVLITPDGQTLRRRINGITRRDLMNQARAFTRGVSNPLASTAYLKPAQYLYDALIEPIEELLGEKNINNLSFILDDGLRTLPIAALHDGEQFLIEKYSLGLMPSFSLTNTSGYLPPKENQLLALGASEFDEQQDLPAALLEVEIITQEIWQEKTNIFLDQQFTIENLLLARERNPYGIVHLATHAEFSSSGAQESYIQFQDQKLTLDEVSSLGLGDPPIELLVLSACRTALGDRQSELGFAGLALNSGAKAAIGSLWYVSDVGTMGLMAKLYDELQDAPTKASALQQAQLALLNNQVSIRDSQLLIDDRSIPLPDEIPALANADLSHPYYWSGFTLVGNPW